jgi:hypothetical protein
MVCRLSADEAGGTGVVLDEPGFVLGERGRRDGFAARRGESLVSLVIFKDLLKSDVSYCTLAWWNGASVNRDFVDFFDQKREVQLSEVSPAESDKKLAVM